MSLPLNPSLLASGPLPNSRIRLYDHGADGRVLVMEDSESGVVSAANATPYFVGLDSDNDGVYESFGHMDSTSYAASFNMQTMDSVTNYGLLPEHVIGE